MKAIAFTSAVLLHLFCYAEGSVLDPVGSILGSDVSSQLTCGSPGVDLLSCIFVQVIETYIYVICNGLRVLENLAAIIGCLSCLLPDPLKQILQAFFNGVILGSEELTDVCTAGLGGLSGYVKGKCPKLNLFSVTNDVLSPPLIKGKEILEKIQCLRLDLNFDSFPIQDLQQLAELFTTPSWTRLHAQLSN